MSVIVGLYKNRTITLGSYLFIVNHPLLWVFLGLLVGFYLILWSVGLKVETKPIPILWLRRNYVYLILTIVGILAIVALTFYLVEIGISVASLVDRLRESATDRQSTTVDLRNLAYAVAVLVGVLAATTTVFFSSIRVWINERTATATEVGLITDRINKAVEGLGAEKAVSRVWRNVTYELDGVTQIKFEDQEERLKIPHGATNLRCGEWGIANRTLPNLEVRIGAIYALERIAQDSDRDHVQIMEILCAYVRQNAPAASAEPLPESWIDALEKVDYESEKFNQVKRNIHNWAGSLRRPREDIKTALHVIGCRTNRQVMLEGSNDDEGTWKGFIVDLSDTNLQRAILSKQNFKNADFSQAHMQAADLKDAKVQNAKFSTASMQKSDLSFAKLQQADFRGTNLQFANIYSANIQNVKFSRAVMIGAFLQKSQMQGSSFVNADLTRAELSQSKLQNTRFNLAKMQGAYLGGVKAQDANFTQARMEECYLRGAYLEGAIFRDTKLGLANLSELKMQGANFFAAQMQGVNLTRAQMDHLTDLRGATLQGALFRFIDFSRVAITQKQLDETFGDQTVILPDNLDRPTYWPELNENWIEEFERQWRTWQKKNGYAPER